MIVFHSFLFRAGVGRIVLVQDSNIVVYGLYIDKYQKERERRSFESDCPVLYLRINIRITVTGFSKMPTRTAGF